MIKHYIPEGMRAPFSHYSHGVEIPPGARVLLAAGQLGVTPGDHVPDDAGEQARLCFENIGTVLRAACMDFSDIVKVNTYMSNKADMAAFRAARETFLPTPPPASTTLFVSGFAGDKFKIEIEVVAAKVD